MDGLNKLLLQSEPEDGVRPAAPFPVAPAEPARISKKRPKRVPRANTSADNRLAAAYPGVDMWNHKTGKLEYTKLPETELFRKLKRGDLEGRLRILRKFDKKELLGVYDTLYKQDMPNTMLKSISRAIEKAAREMKRRKLLFGKVEKKEHKHEAQAPEHMEHAEKKSKKTKVHRPVGVELDDETKDEMLTDVVGPHPAEFKK